MKKKLISLRKCIRLLFGVVMILGMIPVSSIAAKEYDSGAIVSTAGDEIEDTSYKEYQTVLGDHTGIAEYTGKYYDMKANDGTRMLYNTPYVAYFSLNYEGIPLTVKSTVRLLTDGIDDRYDYGNDQWCKVYISNGKLNVAWVHVDDAEVEWKTEIYDNNGVSYLKYFLIGFFDPDESDYTFNNPEDEYRSIYYIDAGQTGGGSVTASQTFKIEKGAMGTGGFFRTEPDKLFDDAIFIVNTISDDITQDASSFIFNSITPDQGNIDVPYLYSLKYNITYDLNDADSDVKATMEDGNPTSYVTSPNDVNVTVNPTRDGFDFLGWKEVYKDGTESKDYTAVVPAESSGDKQFRAHWLPHSYSVEYYPNAPTSSLVVEGSTENQPDREFDVDYNLSPNGFSINGYVFRGWTYLDGQQETLDFSDKDPYKNLTTVDKDTVKLYAQWRPIEYIVKFDPNAPESRTATGEMDDQKPLKFDVDYNLNENKFAIDGYDFLGWSTVSGEQPVTYNDKAGFRNLTEIDGSTVTMYAQWQPWTYTLAYNANGGEGNMPDDVFSYYDEKMDSNANKFVRDGYSFEGFLYTSPDGKKYMYKDINDFRDILTSLGKNSKIILVAQWSQLPDSGGSGHYYIAPVTGIK